jgi:hypothetical protein
VDTVSPRHQPHFAAFGKPIEVWFQDEARVGQKGGHTYVWAPIGSRRKRPVCAV